MWVLLQYQEIISQPVLGLLVEFVLDILPCLTEFMGTSSKIRYGFLESYNIVILNEATMTHCNRER